MGINETGKSSGKGSLLGFMPQISPNLTIKLSPPVLRRWVDAASADYLLDAQPGGRTYKPHFKM